MIAIKYTLTHEDYREIERARRGGIVRRIVRVSFGSLAGFVGVYTIWQALVLFPWNHPFGNLLIACMGLICVWGGDARAGASSDVAFRSLCATGTTNRRWQHYLLMQWQVTAISVASRSRVQRKR